MWLSFCSNLGQCRDLEAEMSFAIGVSCVKSFEGKKLVFLN